MGEQGLKGLYVWVMLGVSDYLHNYLINTNTIQIINTYIEILQWNLLISIYCWSGVRTCLWEPKEESLQHRNLLVFVNHNSHEICKSFSGIYNKVYEWMRIKCQVCVKQEQT